MARLFDDSITHACRIGDISALSAALQRQPNLLHLREQSGWTLLSRCAACDQIEAVRYLLQQGADPNVKNVIGETALHQAVDRAGTETALELLKAGADPNAQNIHGETPLHLAAKKGCSALVKLLLLHEAEPLLRTKEGLSAFDVCSNADLKPLLSPLETKASQTPVLDTSSEPCDEIPPIPPQSFDRLSISPQTSPHPSDFPGFFTSPPYTPKESSGKNFSVLEPDAEKADVSMRIPDEGKHLALVQWLRQLHLEEAVKPLLEAGFDDLEQLVAEMKRTPMTPEQLGKVGIGKIGHAVRLLAALETELQQSQADLSTPRNRGLKRYWGCCTSIERSTGLSSYPTLEQWLSALDLSSLLSCFTEAGYTELDQVLLVMRSSYAFTDSSLEQDLHILKPGYRHRILSKLKEDCLLYDPPLRRALSHVRMERAESPVACEFCTMM